MPDAEMSYADFLHQAMSHQDDLRIALVMRLLAARVLEVLEENDAAEGFFQAGKLDLQSQNFRSAVGAFLAVVASGLPRMAPDEALLTRLAALEASGDEGLATRLIELEARIAKIEKRDAS